MNSKILVVLAISAVLMFIFAVVISLGWHKSMESGQFEPFFVPEDFVEKCVVHEVNVNGVSMTFYKLILRDSTQVLYFRNNMVVLPQHLDR